MDNCVSQKKNNQKWVCDVRMKFNLYLPIYLAQWQSLFRSTKWWTCRATHFGWWDVDDHQMGRQSAKIVQSIWMLISRAILRTKPLPAHRHRCTSTMWPIQLPPYRIAGESDNLECRLLTNTHPSACRKRPNSVSPCWPHGSRRVEWIDPKAPNYCQYRLSSPYSTPNNEASVSITNRRRLIDLQEESFNFKSQWEMSSYESLYHSPSEFGLQFLICGVIEQ